VSLYEVKRTQHNRAYPFPSGVDLDHFNQARTRQADPDDQKDIPHPRLGFCGVIDERMDIDLLRGIAELRPDWHIVMIGPVVKIDPATLPQAPNIHYVRGKSYNDLPAYFSGWDVGILPFARNDSTRFISPTKTPEYLAAGLPVVSTSIRDVVRPYEDLGLAHIADTPEDFVNAVEEALKDPANPEWRSGADEFLLTKSWDSTWAAMNTLIYQVMDEKAAVSDSITPTEGAEQACSIS
jgi:UDP-galactopyranose mutase